MPFHPGEVDEDDRILALVSALLGYAFHSVLQAADAYLLGSLPTATAPARTQSTATR